MSARSGFWISGPMRGDNLSTGIDNSQYVLGKVLGSRFPVSIFSEKTKSERNMHMKIRFFMGFELVCKPKHRKIVLFLDEEEN